MTQTMNVAGRDFPLPVLDDMNGFEAQAFSDVTGLQVGKQLKEAAEAQNPLILYGLVAIAKLRADGAYDRTEVLNLMMKDITIEDDEAPAPFVPAETV